MDSALNLLWIWSVYEKFFVNSKIVFTPTRDVTLPKLQITLHFFRISNKYNRDYKNGRSVLLRITEEIRRNDNASKKKTRNIESRLSEIQAKKSQRHYQELYKR
jgi:hypothetical protein